MMTKESLRGRFIDDDEITQNYTKLHKITQNYTKLHKITQLQKKDDVEVSSGTTNLHPLGWIDRD